MGGRVVRHGAAPRRFCASSNQRCLAGAALGLEDTGGGGWIVSQLVRRLVRSVHQLSATVGAQVEHENQFKN